MRRIARVAGTIGAGVGVAAVVLVGPVRADPTDTSVPGGSSSGAPLTLAPAPSSPNPTAATAPASPASSAPAVSATPAVAGGAGGAGGAADYAAGKAAIATKDWPAAIARLRAAVAFDPSNPDIHNFLGFAYRKAGDLPNAMKYYREALRLNPKHKGALEYQGEAYLMLKQPTAAKANLAKLKTLCGTKCEEYKDLNKAIAAYKPAKKK